MHTTLHRTGVFVSTLRDGCSAVVLGAEHVMCSPDVLCKTNIMYLIGTETEYCYTAELIYKSNYNPSIGFLCSIISFILQ